MTTQEKLKEIEQQIRKDIPRLMKPTEGCLVKYDNDIYKIVKYSGEFNLIVYQGEFDVLQPLTKRIHKDSISSEDIIGHEIMINDVLEWLENKYRNEDILYKGNNIFTLIGYGLDYTLDEFEWDLSKPLLKDQSEELINFLHNLKNQ